MLNLMLVDDEDRIRLGLEKIISRFDIPIEILGSYANGMDALVHVSKLKPESLDVLIVDIEMPMMNGFKLIQQIRLKQPQVYIMILSGFSEFEYARKSLRLGVNDYLLKPIDKEELYRLLEARVNSKSEKEDPSTKLLHTHDPIERAKQLILQTYDRPLDLIGLAEQINICPSYLSQLFSKKTGTTITEYLNHLRIGKAMQFLDDHPHMKMYEIGHLVGYGDQKHFFRMFRKVTGLTPKAYQSRNQT